MGSSGKLLTLSQIQSEVLLGTILGDGFLEQNGINCRLQIQHGRRQRDYVDWLYKIFRKWTLSPPREVGKNDYRFRTVISSEFTRYHRLFYPDGRKIVPSNIKTLFTSPRSFAVLYMDDGKRRPDCHGVYLDTLAFSREEQGLLMDCLRENFGLLDTRLHWNGDGYHIYIPAKNKNNLLKILSPFVIASMRYKLPVTP